MLFADALDGLKVPANGMGKAHFMTHPRIRWNPELEECFCLRCGRTSDHIMEEVEYRCG